MSVLVVVTEEAEAPALVRVGRRCARALETSLLVLAAELEQAQEAAAWGDPVALALDEPPPDDLPAVARGVLAAIAAGDAREAPSTAIAARLVRGSDPLRAVLAQIADSDIEYLVAAKRRRGDPGARLGQQLFASSPAHTVLVASGGGDGDDDGDGGGDGGAATRPWRRILVPVSGGPNARQALRLGAALAAAEDGGVLTALLVHPAAGELPREVGARQLEAVLARAGIAPSTHVVPRVELADDRRETVRAIVAEGVDLLLIGASQARELRDQLYGHVPVAADGEPPPPTVAVIRRRFPYFERIKARIGRWLDVAVPQLSREDRINLYAALENGSVWNFDFMALMGLSTAIATFGLLQDSGAVVIGAMLVAPLMTPILGAGLALVQGNLPLMRVAGKAIALGYVMALGIAFVTAAIFPIDELTPQLVARGGPTLLDLFIALLSGVAAAHCQSRPGLLAALPGVAIAAALVPPIATTGVSFALGAGGNGWGALLLFATNVVAIVLGAAAQLWAAGVRDKPGRGRRWVRLAVVALLLGTVALSFPLTEGLRRGRVPEPVRARVEKHVAALDDVALVGVEATRDGRGRSLIEVRVRAAAPLSAAAARDLAAAVQRADGQRHRVRVRTEVAIDVP